jgi:hypothetical protein
MQTQSSSKAVTKFQFYSGLLFFVLYLGNLFFPLLHDLELSRACRHSLSDQVELWSLQAGADHDKDSCSICLNSFFNHFFEVIRQTANIEPLPAYRDCNFIEASQPGKSYGQSYQPRAPPELFAIV